MRTKVTLVLLFLNVALFYCIFQFVVIDRPTDRSAVVLPPGVAAADRLEIRRTGAEPLVLEKRGDNWFLGAPYDWPADRNAVDRLLNELALLRHETSFEVANLADTGQKLADYGLEPAAAVLDIGIGQRRIELKIGATTQVQNRLYVLDPEGTRIHVVNRSLVDALQLGPDRLRNTALVDIPVFEARSLAVQLPAPSNLRVRLARSAQRWLLESPIQTRADKNAVELALSRLHELKVTRFIDTAKGLATGLDNPALRVTVEGNQRRVILLLGAPVSTEPKPGVSVAETELYARLEDRAAVFTVTLPDALLDSLRNAQTELRDRRLLEFERASVTALTLKSPSLPEITLQRLETGAWQVLSRQGAEPALPQPADPVQVNRLLEQLAQLRAVTFLSDAPFPADLEQWGFNRPAREVALTFAAEPASPSTTTTLQLGVTRDVDGQPLTHARLADAQFVYLVRAGIVDELPVVARHFRLRTLRDLPPGARITGLSLRRLADNSTVFTRELAAGQTWETTLAAEKPELQSAVQQLLTELRTLRARDFVRDTFSTTLEVDGQARPWVYQLDATIALSGAGEGNEQRVTSTLLLGERDGGASQLVGSAEFNTVFHATQPLLDALFALTFGPRDPGVPPADTDTPAPTPPAPAS
ncbi:MAG TPA: DUF4340 domain-containing protein [Opitutaceae bacterium]|nr:DUF4340 domain-containing protein [Opitutaceae bacterium]